MYDGTKGICNSNAAIAKIDVDPKKADTYFVSYLLNFELVQRQIKNLIVSLLPRVNLGDINNIQVPIPPVEEQGYIAKLLMKLDEVVEIEQSILSNLIRIKNGLMQDLLTGKVPVNALLETQPQTTQA